jgi:hypothetical protein
MRIYSRKEPAQELIRSKDKSFVYSITFSQQTFLSVESHNFSDSASNKKLNVPLKIAVPGE